MGTNKVSIIEFVVVAGYEMDFIVFISHLELNNWVSEDIFVLKNNTLYELSLNHRRVVFIHYSIQSLEDILFPAGFWPGLGTFLSSGMRE